MRMTLLLLLVCFCALFIGACTTSATAPSQEFQQLLEEDWEFQLREDPLFATRAGDHRYNDRLPSRALADIERRANQEQIFLERLLAIDRSRLTSSEQVSYDIFARQKRDRVAEFEFRAFLMPISNREGFHTSFPQLPERVPLQTRRDFENYISRLRGFHTYARENIGLMRQGLEEGYALPRVVLEGIEDTAAAHFVEDPEESALYAPFEQFPETVPQADQTRLRDEAREAIMGSVVPGYRELLKFFVEEYVPGGRLEIGASTLPSGQAFYEHRVRMFTTLEITPQDVHELGLAEVERIRNEMEATIGEVGFKGSFEAFLHFLRTDPRFYVKTSDQLLKEISWVMKRMDGELPKLFKTLPRTPYGVKPIPDFIAPKTTSAYYEQPGADGRYAGFYRVNTYGLPSRPLYELEALSLHEAVPGHHLQIALAQELEELPPFRRFAQFTAFVEGWGLYAERLGLEVGFYTDPYSNFGRLTYEMWRACRLVVDTGIHNFGWTRQQAIDFMAENTALTLLNITNEVDRYISWPGQALGYKMGELKIRELRSRTEEALGEMFDVREFHDVVLRNGAVPLEVLEAQVEEYLERARS